jgi:hypothetical protein
MGRPSKLVFPDQQSHLQNSQAPSAILTEVSFFRVGLGWRCVATRFGRYLNTAQMRKPFFRHAATLLSDHDPVFWLPLTG